MKKGTAECVSHVFSVVPSVLFLFVFVPGKFRFSTRAGSSRHPH